MSTLTSGESWFVGSVNADCSNALSIWPFVAVNGSWFALVSIVPAATSENPAPPASFFCAASADALSGKSA